MNKPFALVILLIIVMISQAQTKRQPQLEFPLHLMPAPSGTFAEIRSNHFHSGIDLRIGGEDGIGTPVYAPADGYVIRLRVSAYSGGKMLYIAHDGGITTVYFHLDGYNGAIADFVYDIQRKKESYAFDTTLAEGVLPIRKGQLVAFAGNSGASGGPHLHYEVRDTRTFDVFNPLAYGVKLEDRTAPTIRGIRLLPVDRHSRVNGSQDPHQFALTDDPMALGTINNPISVIGRFYISVYATDCSEGSTPRNGYDRIDIWVDGVPFFQYRMERIAFSETRGINAQLDYDKYLSSKQGYIITRRLEGDPIRPARTFGDGSIGFIDSDTTLHRVIVAVTDYNGNQAVRAIYVRNSLERLVPMHVIPEHPSYHLSADSLLVRWPLSVSRGEYQIEMPSHMVYYDDQLIHGTQKDRRYLSPILTVKPWRSPYPPHYTYQIRVPLLIGYEPEQQVLCSLRDNKLTALTSRVVERRIEGKYGRWLEADSRVFGNFVVAVDTTAPYVKPINFKEGGKAPKVLNMKMGDNLSGVNEYRCYINEQWVLAEFDGKTATLSIDLKQVDSEASNLELTIFLTDCCRNHKELTYHLTR